MINDASETKHIAKDIWQRVGFNNSIGSSDMYDLLPPLSQGTGEYQRVGARVSPTYFTLKGQLAINTNEERSLVPELRLMVLNAKAYKNYVALNGAGIKLALANTLLEVGDGTKTSYDGSVIRHDYPINNDVFTVLHDKKYKLASSYAAVSNQRTADDTRRYVNFTLKVKLPKTLMYEDAGGLGVTYPQNAAPFIALGFCYPDDTTPSDLLTPIIGNLHARMTYEDM